VLQCAAVCGSVLQCVALCCKIQPGVWVWYKDQVSMSVLQCAGVCLHF